MTDLILSVMSSVVISGFLTAALIFLAKTWIGERIKQSIENEYRVALERLRADNAQYQAVQAVAMSSMSATRHAAVERRLQSIERLWSAIMRLRAATPAAVTFADALVANEYGEFFKNWKLAAVLSDVSLDRLVEEIKLLGDVEECGLYVGETLYLLFFVYRAVVGRLVFLFEQGREKGELLPWYGDSGVQQHLRCVATQKELADFDGLKCGQFAWVQSLLETKILQHANRIISGHESADFGLEQAQRIAGLAASKSGA